MYASAGRGPAPFLPIPVVVRTRVGDCMQGAAHRLLPVTSRCGYGGWQPGAVQWSPRPAETVALTAIGLGLALAVLLVDPAGRILLGAAALLVFALAARDALLRPRLSA